MIWTVETQVQYEYKVEECYTLPHFHHLTGVIRNIRYFKGAKSWDASDRFKNYLVNI